LLQETTMALKHAELSSISDESHQSQEFPKIIEALCLTLHKAGMPGEQCISNFSMLAELGRRQPPLDRSFTQEAASVPSAQWSALSWTRQRVPFQSRNCKNCPVRSNNLLEGHSPLQRPSIVRFCSLEANSLSIRQETAARLRRLRCSESPTTTRHRNRKTNRPMQPCFHARPTIITPSARRKFGDYRGRGIGNRIERRSGQSRESRGAPANSARRATEGRKRAVEAGEKKS
jgi:hypothetical protein